LTPLTAGIKAATLHFSSIYMMFVSPSTMLSVISIITVILTKEVVMAIDGQCAGDYQFKSPFLPGESCEAIYNKNEETRNKSGYYWILNRDYCGMTYTGSSCKDIYNNNPETVGKSGYYRINDSQWFYCDMTKKLSTNPRPDFNDPDFTTCAGVGGKWRSIANINISAGDDCPDGWRKDTHSGVSFCRMVSDSSGTCSSTFFSTNGISYQSVCGRVRGYQKGWSAGFGPYHNAHSTIDKPYVEGLSITHGNPRQHIWSFATGAYDGLTDNSYYTNGYNCPCAPGSAYSSPPFVGTDYYCESGTFNTWDKNEYYFNDPLWDGSGCITSNCCDNPTQPWFYKELSEISTDNVEVRICSSNAFVSRGSTLIDQVELYVQ